MDRSRGTLAAVLWLVVGLFLEIIALGVLALWWQSAAWISQVRHLHAGNDGKFHINQATILWQSAPSTVK